ncbi:hypothetical protein BpHYR1_048949 [Brachionus plicatilis]|uniref:Uncharacterized protein n=1 Tax=Brachionus plicatilis TaxID=10195 RepID=A0A3M7QUS8_BRAPC|nr:hypothetical protein BpHYR1_048949 [Brachionus plicatilis]
MISNNSKNLTEHDDKKLNEMFSLKLKLILRRLKKYSKSKPFNIFLWAFGYCNENNKLFLWLRR